MIVARDVIEFNNCIIMSLLKWLRTPVFIFKKDISVRTFIIGSPARKENDAPDNSEIETKLKREVHPLSVCLEYMKSKAYKKTYGDKPVWHLYVRNFKGHLTPKTRSTCVMSDGSFRTSNPCPICRDCYLMPHYTNIDLLKQFISPHGGEILDSKITGVCQKQHQNIVVAVKKAQDYGYLTFYIPHRHYMYSLYCKE